MPSNVELEYIFPPKLVNMYLLVLKLLFVLKAKMFIKEYQCVAGCDLMNVLALDSEPYEAFVTNDSYGGERAFVNSM